MEKKMQLKSFGLILSIILLVACGGGNGEPKKASKSETVSTQTQKLSAQFNVNELIGKRISEVKQILGRPSTEFTPNQAQLRLDPTMSSSAEWNKNGVSLLIDFKGNQQINYIFVTNDGTKYTKEDLIRIANLNPESKRYNMREQRTLNGQGITGLHICGKGVQNSFCP
jgi:hypothetical protein